MQSHAVHIWFWFLWVNYPQKEVIFWKRGHQNLIVYQSQKKSMILSKFFFSFEESLYFDTHTHSYSEESRTRWTGGLLLTAHFAYCFCFCFCPFPPTALPASGSSSSGKAGEVQGKRRKQRNGEKQRKWRRNRGQSSANCSPYIECSVSFLGLGLGLCLGMLMGSPLPRPLDSPPSYSCDCCGRMQNWSIWASSLAGSLALCLWWATKSPSPSPSPSPYTIPHHFDFLFWTSCANMYNLYPLPGYLKRQTGPRFRLSPERPNCVGSHNAIEGLTAGHRKDAALGPSSRMKSLCKLWRFLIT